MDKFRFADVKSSKPLRGIHGRAAALIIGLAALLAAANACAQSLSVRLGFDGAYVEGRWSPVRIDVSADGEPFTGQVEVEIPQTTLLSVEPTYVLLSAPVDVESRTTKQLWLSVPLQAAPYPLRARLVNAGGETVAEEEVPLREGAVADRFALVLDPSGERWSWLVQGDGGGPFLATATVQRAADLPSNALLLSSATAIVAKDDFPLNALSPAQLAALVDYVRYGGNLVLTGGSTPPSIPKALADHLPLLPTGRVVPVQAGGAMAPAWELDAPTAAILLAGEIPLATKAAMGKGSVTYIAVNPALPVSRSLVPAGAWSAGLAGGDERRWPAMSLTQHEEIWRILSRARIETRMPLLLAAALGAYAAAAIGAVWLARRQRTALIAAAVLVVAASLATHAIASFHGISDRTGYAELQIVQGVAEGIAVSRAFGIVASSAPVPFPLEVRAPAPPPFPAAAGRTSVAAAVTPEGILFPAVRPGAAVRFIHESLEPFPVSARVEQGDRARLRIENRGDSPLSHAYIVGRDWFAPLGTIEAGGSVSLEAPHPVEGSSSFVTLSVQSHLERLSARERPSNFEARVISFAVSHALNDALYSGRRDLPLLVSLAQPAGGARPDPEGPAVRRRVIIAPFAEGVAGGRNAN